MNELQLFRTQQIDTLRIAERTGQTEAQVWNAMHKQAREDRQRLLRYQRENRRFGVGR